MIQRADRYQLLVVAVVLGCIALALAVVGQFQIISAQQRVLDNQEHIL